MDSDRIVICRPKIIAGTEYARLEADIMFPGKSLPEKLWVEVEKKYADKLVDDRVDGFLVWLLPYAMRNGYSISCEAPVSRRLLYQLNHYLLHGLSNFIEEFRRIEVEAEACQGPVCSCGCVATGWTGGVDSMYTLWKMNGFPLSEYRLTHLVVMSCGALEGGDNSSLVRTLASDAENSVGKETGLEVIMIDSNIEYIVAEPFLSVSDYRLAGAALCLQGLFGKFYISSTYEYASTRFYEDACSFYSLFSLPLLCTEATSIISIGGALSRLDKLRAIADFPLSKKYLHPCIYIRHNCGKCDKCIRTETALFALGKLDEYESVFDVEYFYSNKNMYFSRLLSLSGNQHCKEVISELQKKCVEFSPEVIQQARIMSSARKVVEKNKELINSRLIEK